MVKRTEMHVWPGKMDTKESFWAHALTMTLITTFAQQCMTQYVVKGKRILVNAKLGKRVSKISGKDHANPNFF
jgi:hypothetical protein